MKSIHDFYAKKQAHKKISMITCYDYTMAQLVNQSDVDCILVGDSAAMVMHGHKTTLNISTALMCVHIEAVTKGAPQKFIVGDMPFMSYRKSLTANMTAIEKIMKAGSHAIKLEGAHGNLELIHHAVQSGVPVMGHIGLTPQSIYQLGGFKVQGQSEKAAQELIAQARLLEEAGCFSIVLECVPTAVAQKITESLEIPTIGIGAGPHTDGQVLVLQDMLGLNKNFKPKFVKNYLQGADLLVNAMNTFHSEVEKEIFPSPQESYS